MSRIFRKIRGIKLTGSDYQKYLKYAIGEILLVVIGILIALGLNNRSIEIEKKKTFNIALNQLYTNLYCEQGWYEFTLAGLIKQKSKAQKELLRSEAIKGTEIPYTLVYLNSEYVDYNTNSQHIFNQLQANISSNEQNVLVNQVNNYYSVLKDWKSDTKKKQTKFFNALFEKYDFPYYPRLDLYNEEVISALEFSEEDIEKAKKIRKDKSYKIQLQSTINRLNELIVDVNYRLNEAKALLEYFDENKYNLLLNFDNIGIIGSALPNGWEESVSMELIDKKKSIWKIEIELVPGVIKFRNGNSWNQNWGGIEQLNGAVLFFGKNIPVQKGYHEIKLNIVEKVYSIKKINSRKNG